MKLDAYLKEKDVTQAEFAALCGVTQGTISRLLPQDGRPALRRPSYDLARRIERESDGAVTVDDLLGDDPPALQVAASASPG